MCQKLSKGYTLLELLIAISITSIIFTAGFASYRDFQRRQQLQSALRMIRADLHLAQQFAIAGRKPDMPSGNVCETSSLNGYIFDRVNSSSYQIVADCAGGDVVVVGPVSLPTGVQLNALSPGPNTLLFRVLGRGTDRTSNLQIPVQYAGLPIEQIVVAPSGEIR